MAEPSELPTWASDATYSSGPDIGEATRLEPTSGEKATGFVRATRLPARKMNWTLGMICDWLAHFKDVTDDHETRVDDLESLGIAHDGRLDILEAFGFSVVSSESTLLAANFSNITGSIGSLRIDALKVGSLWIGSIQITDIDVSSNASTQLTVSLPGADDLSADNRANGSGHAWGGSQRETVEVFGVSGTSRLLLRWLGYSGADTDLRANFTYREG